MTHELKREIIRESGHGTDLWRVILAPVIWVAHFLFCYIYAAVYCEKLGRDAALLPVKTPVLIATALALLAILWLTRGLWRVRARSLTEDDFDFEHNSVEERHRFLSHVALMLCALSVVAVLYVALPVIYLGDCR